MIKGRIGELDRARGIATLLVMLAHTGENFWGGDIVSILMLPTFFIISGYLLDTLNFFSHTKNLLIAWVIISYTEAYLNVSTIKLMINNPKEIISIFQNTSIRILSGQAIWFVPCLILSSLIAVIIILISKRNTIGMLLISFAITIVSFYLLCDGNKKFWSIDTALVNQFLIIVGFIIKDKYDINKLFCKKMFIIIPNIFLCEIILFKYILHMFWGYDVRNSGINNIFIYLILAVTGSLLVIVIAHILPEKGMMCFLGQHSLLYYAFGAHGYIVGRKVIQLIEIKFSISNATIRAVIICSIACVAWIIPALIIDRTFPVLNGRLKLGNWFIRKNSNEKK